MTDHPSYSVVWSIVAVVVGLGLFWWGRRR